MEQTESYNWKPEEKNSEFYVLQFELLGTQLPCTKRSLPRAGGRARAPKSSARSPQHRLGTAARGSGSVLSRGRAAERQEKLPALIKIYDPPELL